MPGMNGTCLAHDAGGRAVGMTAKRKIAEASG
jgi:hypothetical protein